MRRMLFFLLMMAVVLTACTQHHSPLSDPNGKQLIFKTDEVDDFFATLFTECSKIRPTVSFKEVSKPVQGVDFKLVPLMDPYSVSIRIYKGKAVDSSGKEITGCYLDIKGSGTTMLGPGELNDFYSELIRRLSGHYSTAYVSNLQRVIEKKEKENVSRSEDGVNQNSTAESIKTRLDELSQLREDNIITDEEYIDLRAKILNDI